MNLSNKGKDKVYNKLFPFQQGPYTISDPFSVSSNQNNKPRSCKGGISDTISPTKIMTDKSINYKNILVYRLDSTVKYTSKTLLIIAISHLSKVPYSGDQVEIYKTGSSL